VWTGRIERAKPSCAICATFVASVFVSVTFVATTPIDVFCPARERPGAAPARSASIAPRSPLPSGVRTPASRRPVAVSTTSP